MTLFFFLCFVVAVVVVVGVVVDDGDGSGPLSGGSLPLSCCARGEGSCWSVFPSSAGWKPNMSSTKNNADFTFSIFRFLEIKKRGGEEVEIIFKQIIKEGDDKRTTLQKDESSHICSLSQ